jgi:hypothetical protein
VTAHAGPIPVPARITLALNLRDLHGDQVDHDLGVWESPAGEWEPGTAVDRWEDGTLVPTAAQIKRLAALTGQPAAYFYRPPADWEREPNRTHMCERGRRGDNGYTVIRSWIDDRGVLHVEQETPDRPSRRPSKPKERAVQPTKRSPRGAHVATEDPNTPGVCAHCPLPIGVPNARHITAEQLPPSTPGPQDRAAGRED